MLTSTLLAIALTLSAPGAKPQPQPLPKTAPGADERARFEAAADYSERHDGRVLMVVRGDTIVFARAANGWKLGRAHPIMSGVKGLLCPLVMTAIDDGAIALDDAVGPPPARFDATWGAGVPVRVRDLLWMTSGLDEARWWAEVDGAEGRARAHMPADRYAFARGLEVLQTPGSAFQYSGVHAAALGAYLVTRGLDPASIVRKRVLAPLGVRPAAWAKDEAGQAILSHGMSLTAEQWARVGMLMRDDGRFRGEAVLAPGRLARCLVGSTAEPAYGFGWWLNVPLDAPALAQIPAILRDALVPATATPPVRLFGAAPPDTFAAIGTHGQRLYVMPSLGLVVVRFAARAAKDASEGFADDALLRRLLPPTR